MITMAQFAEAVGVEWQIAMAIAEVDDVKDLGKCSPRIRYRYRQQARAAINAWNKSPVTEGKA